MASTYTRSQLDNYFNNINLPLEYQLSASPTLNVEFLTALHVHQISAAPYENLILHYAASHTVSLDSQDLYRKIVINARGRGGYCMELASFFNHILRSLGFNAITAGVKIRPRYGGVPKGDYMGWVHIVNIVTFPDGSKYMSDVGFGGDGPIAPMPLIPNTAMRNIGSQEIRLIFDTIPEQRDPNQRYWIYQYRNGLERPWNSYYCFPGLEFMPEDLVVMNHYTSTCHEAKNIQTSKVLVVRFLRRGSEIVGKVMLVDGEVKKNLGGRTEVIMVCESEEERVKALKEEFGIDLTDEEILGVRGWHTELIKAE